MSLKDTDVKTLGDSAIAKKFKLSLAKVRQLVKVGAEHEKEHNTNIEKAKQVARDHIGERPDYYRMLKKAEKTKVKLKEENGVGSVRGLGYVSGDPAVGVNSYVNTNSMSYDDQNGSNLEWLKKKHIELHNKRIGFNFFDPTHIKVSSNFIKEGISAGSEREIPIIGDPTGASRKMSKVEEDKDPCWKGYEMVGMKKKGGRKVPNCVPVEEGSVSIGHRYDWAGDVNSRARFYGNRPKPTTTKNDEKDDTYKDSNKNKKVRFAKTVKEGLARDKRSLKRDEPITIMKRNDPLEQRKGKESARQQYEREFTPYYARRKIAKTNMTPKDEIKASLGKHHKPGHLPEDWQKVNRKDKTDGLSQKAVNAYRRENPGSKLQTAVTEKDPKGDRAERRKSFCSRMGGMKKRLTSAKTANDPDSRINKALRRWNCEESTQIDELRAETLGAYIKKASSSRKKSLEDSKPDIKTWGKREKGIRTAIRKLTKEDTAMAAAHTPSPQGLRPTTKLGRNAPTEISSRGQSQGLNRTGNTFRSTSSVTPSGLRSMRSASATPTSRMAAQSSSWKPSSVSGPKTATPKTASAPSPRASFGTGGGSMKPSSVTGKTGSITGQTVAKPSVNVAKGMSVAGQEASKKIVPKAAEVAGTVGKVARGLSGPEGAAVTAAAEPLAKKMAASHKAGHQSFTPHGSEGEKASSVFARMKQPSQGRSIGQYEKDVLTPKASETPKAPNPKVDAPTPPERPKFFSRGQAFSAARSEAGGGEGKFSYQSGSDSTPKTYQTNVSKEPYKPEAQLKQTSVKENNINNKPDTSLETSTFKGATGVTRTIHEETKMDHKEIINEAIENILNKDLNSMKENLTVALQEKAMEKLEERKKEIAANYFAQ